MSSTLRNGVTMPLCQSLGLRQLAFSIRRREDQMNRSLLCASVLLLAGCASPVGPASSELPEWGDFELPPPDPSLDPTHLAVGELLATPCSLTPYGDHLVHVRDRREWIVVDISFGRNSVYGPWGGPTPEDKAWITDHGGRVLYDFTVPMLRARIVASELARVFPEMVRAGQSPMVWAVADLTRHDIPDLSVGFAVRLTDEHVTLFEDLGGRVEHRLDFIGVLAGPLPDRSTPTLRDRSDVEYLELSGVGCLA